MLTVKHLHDGIETIHDAPYGVEFIGPNAAEEPGGLAINNSPQAMLEAKCDKVGLGLTFLNGGTAYVMNSNGKTVGVYDLPPGPQIVAKAG